MAQAELTKTIEAKKLNKRTMRPISNDSFTVPFGAIIDLLEEHHGHAHFLYLGEPYEGKKETIALAIKPLE